MSDPVLVEVLRGDLVESAHRGAVAIHDGDGSKVLEIGDIGRPVFPRSAVKVIQALPLVESGAADAFGLSERELALCCASHSGEPAHVALAAAILAKAGLGVEALECGTHWPSNQAATVALAASGAEPGALHNNCSGKHSGFLCTCRHLGLDHRGYVRAGHPFQQMVREALEAVTGAAHGPENCATDGCSIPTYAVPLASLAAGFARLATGKGLADGRVKAVRRLMAACMAEPFFVAGTGRADTRLMQLAPGRIFAKGGAEGIHCAALPEFGLGIALKCDDGEGRGSQAMMAAILSGLFAGEEELSVKLAALARPPILSRNGALVGGLRPSSLLEEAVRAAI